LKLVLGTAQFGLDYGISNERGRPSETEIFDILDYASKHEIDTIHTSYAYGSSEKVIGKFVKKYSASFMIVSKFSYNIFFETLKNLNVKKIYGSLIQDSTSSLEESLSVLNELKEQGVVKKTGLIAYYPKEILNLLNKKIPFDLVQVPFSIFDQRFATIFSILKNRKIEIHVRSVFLQGLLFKNPDRLEGDFNKIKNKLLQLAAISKENGIPISALCINFASLNEHVDKVIIGVDSLENLKENIGSLIYENKVKRIYKKLLALKEEDENIILPINWKQ